MYLTGLAPVAEKWTDIIYFQEVAKPVLYAENILDKGHLGQTSVHQKILSFRLWLVGT